MKRVILADYVSSYLDRFTDDELEEMAIQDAKNYERYNEDKTYRYNNYVFYNGKRELVDIETTAKNIDQAYRNIRYNVCKDVFNLRPNQINQVSVDKAQIKRTRRGEEIGDVDLLNTL